MPKKIKYHGKNYHPLKMPETNNLLRVREKRNEPRILHYKSSNELNQTVNTFDN